jgi:undecaprenyl diphosphate synthase
MTGIFSLLRGNKKIKKGRAADNAGTLPRHIAIIMDGNGRWAKARSLPRVLGHKQGAEVLKNITRYCKNIGVEYLTVYAFSTENWKRPPDEVTGIMGLLKNYMDTFDHDPESGRIRVRFIGDMDGMEQSVLDDFKRIEKKSAGNTDAINLTIAFNYGGRREIVAAAAEAARKVKSGDILADDIDEELFSKLLYTVGMPDPDLLIKPGAEKRISNFLLWQLAYAEMWFTDVLWPDFSEKHIDEAILSFQSRQRRFGGSGEEAGDSD